MRRVFQLVPFLESADAIGDHARNLARSLGSQHAGFIVERAAPELASQATAYRDARVGAGDVLVYHVAHGSPLAGWFGRAPAVRVVDYHGITPPALVRGWDPGLAVTLDRARAQLAELAGSVSLAIAHSEYMRRELVALGFTHTATLPLLVDRDRLATPPNLDLVARLRAGSGGHDLLFVSRMAPSKRVEDLIKAFTVYRRVFCPDARLFLVGRPDTAAYQAALETFVRRLGIEEVHFAGKVPVADLVAYYACADAFVSMSEHEGFGVPWLEAMAFDLPVIAYAAGALPETVGAGGLLFTQKRYEDVAALIHLVLSEAAVADRLVAAGRQRLAAFSADAFGHQVLSLIGGAS